MRPRGVDASEYRLIEKLAAAVADELAARFPAKRVQVRVRKPGIAPAGPAVEYSAATAAREVICSVYRAERTPFAGKTSMYA